MNLIRITLLLILCMAIVASPQLGIPRRVFATANYNIAIQNEAFTPSTIIVHTGDSVVWTNMDPFQYELYYQYGKGGTAVSPFLQPGQTFTLTFTVCDTIDYVTIHSPVTISGIVKVLIQGDVNGDGKVNIFDLTQIGSEFGAVRGVSPNYNASADLNQDGIINIFDLTLVGASFGNTCV